MSDYERSDAAYDRGFTAFVHLYVAIAERVRNRQWGLAIRYPKNPHRGKSDDMCQEYTWSEGYDAALMASDFLRSDVGYLTGRNPWLATAVTRFYDELEAIQTMELFNAQ